MSAAAGGFVTVTLTLAVELAPALSVMVTVTVYVPAPEYAWVAVEPPWGPTVLPSPKAKV